ncbi:MAG: hypothetical protein Q9227_003843 [Pyrenula ochraceoflavens]
MPDDEERSLSVKEVRAKWQSSTGDLPKGTSFTPKPASPLNAPPPPPRRSPNIGVGTEKLVPLESLPAAKDLSLPGLKNKSTSPGFLQGQLGEVFGFDQGKLSGSAHTRSASIPNHTLSAKIVAPTIETSGYIQPHSVEVEARYFNALHVSVPEPGEFGAALEPTDSSSTEDLKIDDVSSGRSQPVHRQHVGRKGLLMSLVKGFEHFRKKTDFVEIAKDGRDIVMTVGQKVGMQKHVDDLCSGCSRIPFNECLTFPGDRVRDDERGREATFYMPIEKILSQREWCKFCRLLFRSVCQPEHDLLQRPPQVHNFLQDNLKHKSFEEWATETPEWRKMVEGIGNRFGILEHNWPFGSSRDHRESAEAAAQVIQSNDKEENPTGGQTDLESLLDSSYQNDLGDILGNKGTSRTDAAVLGASWAGGIGLGVTNEVLADNRRVGKEAQHVIRAAEMATNQLAIFSALKARPLTCWFVVRVFRHGHPRAGQLSVRVFGHGRAPRAPLSQLCSFKLRFERSNQFREGTTQDGQMWYARQLQPFIEFSLFDECLKRCQELHGSICNQYKSAGLQILPGEQTNTFRVIDVRNWKIVEYESRRPEYIALSFCWGNTSDRHFKLRIGNRTKLLRQNSLKDESLPQTFLDAMAVVEKIGAQYLWIDRLCIIQDDEKVGGEKEHQIAQMDRIYGEALFTIVAADGKTADAGLAGVSKTRTYNQVIEEMRRGIYIYLPLEIRQELFPWESRAWTFQEKLLSRRLLVFTNGFAIWHCRQAVWREDVNALDAASVGVPLRWLMLEPPNLPEATVRVLEEDGSTRVFRPPAFGEYAEAVAQYSRRTMTHATDILPAFQGLQRIFESGSLGPAFRYGIPERFLDLALLWQPNTTIKRRESGRNGRCLPSWSWVGWIGTDAENVSHREGSANRYGVKGAHVSYLEPFDVCTDENGGLLMKLGSCRDERIRPMHRWFAAPLIAARPPSPSPSPSPIPSPSSAQAKRPPPRPPQKPQTQSASSSSLLDVATRSETWPTQVNRLSEVISFRTTVQAATPPSVQPQLKNILDDRHLVFETQAATLVVGQSCHRKRKLSAKSGSIFVHEQLQLAADGDERFMLDSNRERIGVAKLHGPRPYRDSSFVEALLLSGAQFFGTEKKVDVLGYPLYNILLVKRDETGLSERIGLGKVFKHAFDRMSPVKTTVVLG